MRDVDVRRALDTQLRDLYSSDESCRIVHELGVCRGQRRVDLAVVNGSLTGYEIKSASDRLDRLPDQAEVYSQIFDSMVLAVADSHLEQAARLVPNWWGLVLATMEDESVNLYVQRKPSQNPSVDVSAVVQLLWRDEALLVLESRGADLGHRSKTRAQLCEILVAEIEAQELAAEVRAAIKARDDWRADAPRA